MIIKAKRVIDGVDPQLEFKLQVGLGLSNGNEDMFAFIQANSCYNPFYTHLKSLSLEGN